MWSGSAPLPYVRPVTEISVEARATAAAELADEMQLAFDQAVDLMVERSQGKSVLEVDALLSDELRRRGIVPVGTTVVAEQIVAALGQLA